MAQIDYHFPRIYSYGENYLYWEYIYGIPLDTYLKSFQLTPDICDKIIELYEAIHFVGFSRVDTALFHIFLTSDDEFKLIDTSKGMKIASIYPKLILDGLAKLKYKNQFLSYVKVVRPDIYNKWFTQNK